VSYYKLLYFHGYGSWGGEFEFDIDIYIGNTMDGTYGIATVNLVLDKRRRSAIFVFAGGASGGGKPRGEFGGIQDTARDVQQILFILFFKENGIRFSGSNGFEELDRNEKEDMNAAARGGKACMCLLVTTGDSRPRPHASHDVSSSSYC
jgi:hypothetical protein